MLHVRRHLIFFKKKMLHEAQRCKSAGICDDYAGPVTGLYTFARLYER